MEVDLTSEKKSTRKLSVFNGCLMNIPSTIQLKYEEQKFCSADLRGFLAKCSYTLLKLHKHDFDEQGKGLSVSTIKSKNAVQKIDLLSQRLNSICTETKSLFKMEGAKDGQSSLLVNMNDESVLAQFESMNHELEPVNGVVQPPVIPPENKPHRNTDSLQFVLKKVVKAVSQQKSSRPFLSPVNAVKLELPDYHSIIKYPMDITTIRKRLENCYYYDVTECIKDFQMIFYNCYRYYNKAGEDTVLMAQTIEKVFVERMQDCPKEELEIPMNIKFIGKAKGKKVKGAGCPKVVDAVLNSKVSSVASETNNAVLTVPSTQAAPLPPPTRTTASLTVPERTNASTTFSPATSPPDIRDSSYSSSNDTHHHISHVRSNEKSNQTSDPAVSSQTLKDVFEMKLPHEPIPMDVTPVVTPIKDAPVLHSRSDSSCSSSSDSEEESRERALKLQQLQAKFIKLTEEIKNLTQQSSGHRDKKKKKRKNRTQRTPMQPPPPLPPAIDSTEEDNNAKPVPYKKRQLSLDINELPDNKRISFQDASTVKEDFLSTYKGCTCAAGPSKMVYETAVSTNQYTSDQDSTSCENEKPFTCELCSEGFAKECDLQQHLHSKDCTF